MFFLSIFLLSLLNCWMPIMNGNDAGQQREEEYFPEMRRTLQRCYGGIMDQFSVCLNSIIESAKGLEVSGGRLSLCYPSVLEQNTPMIKGLRQKVGKRFQLMTTSNANNKEEIVEDWICTICFSEEVCSRNSGSIPAGWHIIQLSWDPAGSFSQSVTITSSILKDKKHRDITNMPVTSFSHKIEKFLEAFLFNQECHKNSSAESPWPAEDGAFLNDYANLKILPVDLISSLALLQQQQNKGERPPNLTLWVALEPKYVINGFVYNTTVATTMASTTISRSNGEDDDGSFPSTQLSETQKRNRMEKCAEQVAIWNQQIGYEMYTVVEKFCLMNAEERRQLLGRIEEPQRNGQEHGGDQTEELKPTPVRESAEQRKGMRNIGKVDPADYGFHSINKVKKRSATSNQKFQVNVECEEWRLDIREKWPACSKIIGNIRDQGHCKSCWAVSVASALTDRECIAREKGAHRRQQQTRESTDADTPFLFRSQLIVSARDAMECALGHNNKCDGGYDTEVWKYYLKEGTVFEACKPYPLPVENPRSDWKNRCFQTCDRNANISSSSADWYSKYKRFKTSGYRILYRNEEGWEQTMMDEIEYNGSITAAFRVYSDFFYHDSKKVYQHNPNITKQEGGHAVRLIGFGEVVCTQPGVTTLAEPVKTVKFWLVANSWGRWSHDNGVFRILRGRDESAIESLGVAWGTAQPVWPREFDQVCQN